jgi:mRNA interferase MazF
VWWASLPEPVGAEPGFRRPMVVVQADAFNASQIHTVLAVALTSNLRRAEAPGNVRISAGEAGLPTESVANVSNIATVDKRFLVEYCGRLRPRTMESIGLGMRLVLDLEPES